MSESREQPTTAEDEGPRPSGRVSTRRNERKILAGLFWLLASLGVMLSVVTVWAHQSLLTTEGWSDAVGDIVTDPEVIDAAGVVVVDQVSEALDLRATVVDVLPAGELYGGLVIARLEEVLADVVSDVAGSEGFQESFAEINRVAHEQSLKAIRGGDEIVNSNEGVLELNVFPLIGTLLVELQEMGVVDPAAEIPDLSEYRPPLETVTQLEAVLGTDLPDDIGTIHLADSERLATIQDGVRAFDLIVVLALVLTALFTILAIATANRRLGMVLWLAIGAAVAVGLGRTFVRVVMDAMTGAVVDGPGGDTVRAVANAAVDSLTVFTVAIASVALITALIAWLLDHRRHRAEQADAGIESMTFTTWVRLHSLPLSVAGLVVIGVLVLSQITGPDVALWAAAGSAVWLIGIRIIGDDNEEEPAPKSAA